MFRLRTHPLCWRLMASSDEDKSEVDIRVLLPKEVPASEKAPPRLQKTESPAVAGHTQTRVRYKSFGIGGVGNMCRV